MASALQPYFVLSTDGLTLRRLAWDEILTIEPLAAKYTN